MIGDVASPQLPDGPGGSTPTPDGSPTPLRVAYFGPRGTFTEQALFTQPDLSAGETIPCSSIPEVLDATSSGEVDLGFAPIENSIEGSVNVTLDALAFDHELLIQREVVIPIELCLMALPGTRLEDISMVSSFPHAVAQCRGFLAEKLPGAAIEAANSTADAARVLAETANPNGAVIANARAAEVYGLEILDTAIDDHEENATRFVAVARGGIPAPTGHDKTTVVVFQRADAPGSLLAILQQFAARAINLTKLESRPTKQRLGSYCFMIDFEGHIGDELIADCLRDLRVTHDVKFLGSYPAAGAKAQQARRDADAAWQRANEWLVALRAQLRS